MSALIAALSRLVEVLPPPDRISAGQDMEDQARGSLAMIVDGAMKIGQPSKLVDSDGCPNCGGEVESVKTPYCSQECKERAGFVRQMRSGLLEGTILKRDRQVALGQKLWHLLGGGRPLRISLIPEKSLARFIAKKEGKCELCGSEATAIDNVGSG